MIDDHVRENMRKLLSDIREGTFAHEWIEQMNTGEPRLKELRAKAADERIEQVGQGATKPDAPRGAGPRGGTRVAADAPPGRDRAG